jgi:2-polyprenyl-6-methoxyphenol hydroxylase-like FAD-dependent oxidoreductase
MMLGYLLGRAGVDTLVLEKHADFLRDFRGDTVHPSTLRIMQELGLLEEFWKLKHSELRALSIEIERRSFQIADFGRVPTPGHCIAIMPQWDFLNFLMQKGRRFPSLKVMMSSEATRLTASAGRVAGIEAMTPDGPLSVSADLVVACDGRSSSMRKAAGLEARSLGSPIDVLWFRLSKKHGDPEQVLGHLERDKMLVTIDRSDYWQCAYVISKGGIDRVHAHGLEAFRRSVADGARFLADRVDELKSFDDVKLLSVTVDRLPMWSKPGVLCIGDAAHAMSPVGGVGVNLAIQDAVAAANRLAAPLKTGTLSDEDLRAIERRRTFPVRFTQRIQRIAQDRIISSALAGTKPKVPLLFKALEAFPFLQRIPGRLVAVGVRPEHIHTPDVLSAP